MTKTNREHQLAWRANNREHVRQKQNEKRRVLRKWFYDEILSKATCIECGESHPATIDFHHRDPSLKVNEVGKMVWNRANKATILAEVAKCDTLCANCHRKYHWNEKYMDV